MEIEEQNVQTPDSGKKKKVSKTRAALQKILSRRASKSISSERGGSASSLENVPTEESSTKRLSSLRRFSRGRNKSDMSKRGAVTERAPRRSFSVDDMANIHDDGARREETDSPGVPIEKDVKVPDFGDSEQFAKPILYSNEGLVPPDTPVHGQGQNPRAVDTRSSSSANISGNDELHEAEAKEAAFEEVTDHVHDAAMYAKESEIEEKVKEIDALRDSSFDYTGDADADATIDAEIERTVMGALVRSDDKEEISAETTEDIQTEEEIETDKEKILIGEEETEIEMTQPESTEVVEAVTAEITEKDAEAFLEAMEDIGVAQVVPQGMEMIDQMAKEENQDQADCDDEEEEAVETADPEASVAKPKRRRRMKIIRRASISLAYLAVGLLIVIIKNKH